MKHLFLCLVLLFLACDGPICIGDLTPEQQEFCDGLIIQYGGIPSSDPPGPSSLPPNPVPPPPTPMLHCTSAEGHTPPANGLECTDQVDNDCDGRIDSGDVDCESNVCSPVIDSRCLEGFHCLWEESKCVPDQAPRGLIYCWGAGQDDLCRLCGGNNGIAVVCVIIDGVAEILPDLDGDGLPDEEDLCPWYNPGGSPCPEGDIDTDGDFVPDQSDSCPFVFNSMDADGTSCANHPEINCQEVFPEFPSQMMQSQDFAWCEHFLPGVNFPVRLCEVDWVTPLPGQVSEDICVSCGGVLVPEGNTCTLQNGWFPQLAVDGDNDGYPEEYPLSDGGSISLDSLN